MTFIVKSTATPSNRSAMYSVGYFELKDEEELKELRRHHLGFWTYQKVTEIPAWYYAHRAAVLLGDTEAGEMTEVAGFEELQPVVFPPKGE